MERYYNKKQQDRDNLMEMYLMGKDSVMNNVPLYSIAVYRIRRFIKRKLSFKKR